MAVLWIEDEPCVWPIKVRLELDAPVDGCTGEGLWALCTEETVKLYTDNSVTGVRRKVILDNTSIFYRELTHGATVEIEFKGQYKPVIVKDPAWTPLFT